MRLLDRQDNVFEEIAAIHYVSFGPLERAPNGILRNIFDTATVFVTYSPDMKRVVAFAFLTEKLGEPYVWVVATHENYRGQGFAGHLLDEIETFVRAMNAATGITLTVHVNNAGAQRLYLEKGYRVLRFLTNYYGSNEHGLLMRRPL
jgi:ribosomal protein S18 acetylase RimI-like enzyme